MNEIDYFGKMNEREFFTRVGNGSYVIRTGDRASGSYDEQHFPGSTEEPGVAHIYSDKDEKFSSKWLLQWFGLSVIEHPSMHGLFKVLQSPS